MKNLRNNDRTVVDLKKVQCAKLTWITSCGNWMRQWRPTTPTVHGQEFDYNAIAAIYPGDVVKVTMLKRAEAYKLLDTWIPRLYLQLSANRYLIYTGDRALSIYKEFCARQFGKRKGSS